MCGKVYDSKRGDMRAQNFRGYKIPTGVTVAHPEGKLRCGPCRKGEDEQAGAQQQVAQPGTVPRRSMESTCCITFMLQM